MSRLLRTALLLALGAGWVPAPMPALASAIAAQEIVLTFENADIETVIQAVSEIVGFSYVLAPDVRGKVTVRTSGAIRREDVFPLFLSILEVHGFTAVRAGDVYKIVRTETARERAIPTFMDPRARPPSPPDVGPPPGTTLPPDYSVTQVLVPRFASAATLANVVRPLVSARGSIIADPFANVLIVTDTAANVGKVAEIVRRLDEELAPQEVHVIRLRYADARYLAGTLNHVFMGAGLAGPPVIVAEPRTNSLIIRARRSELEAVGRLLDHAR